MDIDYVTRMVASMNHRDAANYLMTLSPRLLAELEDLNYVEYDGLEKPRKITRARRIVAEIKG